MQRTVTLVDEQGLPTGEMDLFEAHHGKGSLHRAFSVYLFRNDGQDVLMQRRSDSKLLWPLAWANTCCSHPFPDEDSAGAGQRRLREELGMNASLQEVTSYVYRAEDPGRGVEHEHVTILRGDVDADTQPIPNPAEVAEWKWIAVSDLLQDMERNPSLYAPWFPLGLRALLKHSVSL